METEKTIYHIVTLSDLKTQTKDSHYRPGNLEKDGFIHCTAGIETSLLVLDDYFADIAESDVILVLELDNAALQSEVKYESPAPIQGGGTSHIINGVLFPHIYGSINIDAIAGVGKVERVKGRFVWPASFDGIEKYL